MYARLVERSRGSSTDLHRCMPAAMVHPPRPSVPARPGAALPHINQHRRRRVWRSNPHSATRTLTVPVPRFPPLAVCVRRPSVYAAAPSSWPASANVHNSSPARCHGGTAEVPLIPDGIAAVPRTVSSCHFRTSAPVRGSRLRIHTIPEADLEPRAAGAVEVAADYVR